MSTASRWPACGIFWPPPRAGLIFNCAEKEACTSYNDPRIPCYEVAKKAAGHSGLKDCNSCPIYLNRDVKKMPLLLKS